MSLRRPSDRVTRRSVVLRIAVGVAVFAAAIAIHLLTSRSGRSGVTAGLRAVAALPTCPSSPPVVTVDGGLPTLTLPCLGDGPRVRLSGLRGMPLVVNVWAGPCEPCKREAPLLQHFFANSSGRVRLLGVVDGAYPDTVNDALSAAHGLGMHYASVFDADGRLAASLRVRGIPITLFVDAAGRVQYTKIGELHGGEIEQLTARYLGIVVASV
jgi:cytochrome c biogenesis protein CcmG/thiol:disulfide interchange protein DsbE